jgi:rhamnosyltransferase
MAVYVVYDSDGIIDSYIGYMLSQLRKYVDRLIVVCNMQMPLRGETNVTDYADEVICRKNKGFDIGAYKDAICDYIGFEELKNFDELLLLNDSFFGPFYSLEEMFLKMDSENWDFWGITKRAESLVNYDIVQKEHINSYFLAVRKNMFLSNVFRDYWTGMPYYERFMDVVERFEVEFTQYFAKQGFRYSTYIDTREDDSEDIRYNHNQYLTMPYELIKYKRNPFLKRKLFKTDMDNSLIPFSLKKAVNYIKENTEYDEGLIWSHVIRYCGVAELFHSTCHTYVIDKEKQDAETAGEGDKFIAVLAENESFTDKALEMLLPVCSHRKTVIYSTLPELLKVYENRGFDCVSVDRENEFYMDAISCGKDFKCFCCIRDVDISGAERASIYGHSEQYAVWESLLGSEPYMENIGKIFEREAYLGVLYPCQMIFGSYLGQTSDKYVESSIGSFWMAGKLAQKIDFRNINQAVNMNWSLIAKENGAYVGALENSESLAIRTDMLEMNLVKIKDQLAKYYGEVSTLESIKKVVFSKALKEFIASHDTLYVYGTGVNAHRYAALLPYFEAYVISDGQDSKEEFYGKKVLHLSDVSGNSHTGFILCLDGKHQNEVIPLLKGKKYDYIGI